MKPDFPLEEPEYTQAELFRMVPGLTKGTIQNWIARGVIKPNKPAKHAKVKWTATAVITFRLMLDLIKHGIPVSQALEIADTILQELDDFLDRFEMEELPRGNREYVLQGDRMQEYRQFRVIRDSEGDVSVRQVRADPEDEGLIRMLFMHQTVTILVEADIVFSIALNAVSRLRAGIDPSLGQDPDE